MYLPDKIILSLKDDGHGFEAAECEQPAPGIGLTNMHYRVGLIGAQFSLQSKPREGTLVQLILPANT